MRALVGGIIGAAISAFAWLGIEHVQQTKYGWMVVLVGLITGVAVNKAGSASTAGFARGALALVLTLAGIVGGQKGYAKYMEATTSTAGVASAATLEGGKDAADDEDPAEDSATEPSPSPELTSPSATFDQRSYSKSAMKKNFGEWDMIWMCVAALAAYVTGKGGGSPTPAVSEDQDEANSAEGSADESDDA